MLPVALHVLSPTPCCPQGLARSLLWSCPPPCLRSAHCRAHLSPVPALPAGSWTYPSLGPPTPEPEDSSAADASPQTPKALAGPPDQEFSITQPGRGSEQSDAARTAPEAAEGRLDGSPAGTQQLEAASSSSSFAAAWTETAGPATSSSGEAAEAAQPESQPDSAERLVRLTSLEKMDEEELEDEDFTDALSANTDPFTRQLLLSEARARAADRLKRRAARKAAAAAAAAASQEGPHGGAPEGAREAARPEGGPADQQRLAAAPGSWVDGHQAPCAECAARQAAAGGDGDGDAQACTCRPQRPAEAAAGSAAAGGQEHAGAGRAGEGAAPDASTAGPVGDRNSTKLSSEAAKDGGTAHTSAACEKAEPGNNSNPSLPSGSSAQGSGAAGTAEPRAGSQEPGSGRSDASPLSGSSKVAKSGEAARSGATGPSTPPGSVDSPAHRRSRQQPGRSALISLQRNASKGYCIHRWAPFCCGGGRCAGGTVAVAAAARTSGAAHCGVDLGWVLCAITDAVHNMFLAQIRQQRRWSACEGRSSKGYCTHLWAGVLHFSASVSWNGESGCRSKLAAGLQTQAGSRRIALVS